MKRKVLSGLLGLLLAGTGLAFAMTPNVENGKALFEDPTLGGGTAGKSCKTCHTGGARLGDDFADKTKFVVMGQELKDLTAVVNFCISGPLGGTALDPQGQEMSDLIAYTKTLKGKGSMAKPK
jgi:hypothetical protein